MSLRTIFDKLMEIIVAVVMPFCIIAFLISGTVFFIVKLFKGL